MRHNETVKLRQINKTNVPKYETTNRLGEHIQKVFTRPSITNLIGQHYKHNDKQRRDMKNPKK